MKDLLERGSRQRASISERGFVFPTFVLASIALILLSSPRPAAPAPDLSSAAETIAKRLTADLSAAPEEELGRVIFVVPPVGLVIKLEKSEATLDAEYLLTRAPEKSGPGAFPMVIGAVRLTAVRQDKARAILLWSRVPPREGDELVTPSRITILLLPTRDLAHHPGATAALTDQAFEIAFGQVSRVRVVRLKQEPQGEGAQNLLRTAGEIGLFVEPLVLPDASGVKIAAKARSVLSGYTAGTYAEVVALGPPTSLPTPYMARPAPRTTQPIPAPPAQPSTDRPAWADPQVKEETIPRTSPLSAKAEEAPAGFVITQRESQPGEILLESQKPGPIGKDLEEALVGISAADLDGDGRPELVGISDGGVYVYKWTTKGFAALTGHLETEKFVQYLYVDTADINGNGRDEIFVTVIRSIAAGMEFRSHLRSIVFELDGRRLKPVATDLPYYFRVARIPGQKKPVLLAQKKGRNEPFSGPILRMAWKDSKYVEEEPLPLPDENAWLYNVTILEVGDKGPTAVSSVNWKGRLLVQKDGKEIWKGKENLGPVEHAGFLQTPRVTTLPESLRSTTQPRPEKIAERRVIGRRILAGRPLFGSGNLELITVATRLQFGVQIFGKGANGATVVGYVNSGDKFEKHWETEPIDGAARDVTLADFDGDGRRDVVLLSDLDDTTSLNLFLFRPRKGA